MIFRPTLWEGWRFFSQHQLHSLFMFSVTEEVGDKGVGRKVLYCTIKQFAPLFLSLKSIKTRVMGNFLLENVSILVKITLPD